jgi:phenylalanyl-tRNA synthetase beta chain
MLGFGDSKINRARDDAVVEVEIPANRGDLMCIVGVARELAAASRRTIRLPKVDLMEDRTPVTDLVTVEVTTPELAPRYTARMIVDVQVRPSPEWMARRLEACGIRSINNIVDVTNYVMLELGQPLHAFDYDRLQGRRIVVRRARPAESMVTLDGVERRLDPDILVIADAERPVGVAGMIGGSESEIGPATRRILLEAACFAPTSIRRTSKRLGVRTESSARFERGVDIEGILAASGRAITLMAEVGGGRILRGVVDLFAGSRELRSLEMHWSSVSRLLGMDIPLPEGTAILRGLGFGVEERNQTLRVQVPPFRMDVEREEDLIEEVARHYGYDHIPEAMPVEITTQGSEAPELEADQRVRSILIRTGLTEVLTLSLTNPGFLDRLRLSANDPWRSAVRVQNPLIEDHVQLRTTLIPGLLEVARVNASRRVTDLHIFELGRTFHPADRGVAEHRRLALLLTGRLMRGAWSLPETVISASYFHLKGIIETLLEELRIHGAAFAPTIVPWLREGHAAQLHLAGAAIGTIGELHPDVAAAFDLSAQVFLADLDVEALLRVAVFRPQLTPLPRFPSVRRDLAIIVANSVPASQVMALITTEGGEILESAELFDLYTGPPIPEGHRSLAYALSFRAKDRTLDAPEVETVLARITGGLRTRLRAEIRE